MPRSPGSAASSLPRANILIIDDSDSTRKKIKNLLTQARLVEFLFEAKSGLEGIKLLMEKRVDLVLCDIVMPEFDGFKFLISRASHPELAAIPVILVTSEKDPAMKIKGFENGAYDYVLKPFDDAELLSRIQVQLRLKFRQDELKKNLDQLRELSGKDELTHVYNRRRFMEHFGKEFSRAKRYKHPLSLVLFDVDHFKDINDRWGQQAGDRALVQITAIMQNAMRSCDLIGRYGGAEFTLLLPHTNANGAARSTERVRKKIEATVIPDSDSSLRVTVSAGIAAYPENQATNIEELLARADEALYRAKANGRNRTEKAQ